MKKLNEDDSTKDEESKKIEQIVDLNAPKVLARPNTKIVVKGGRNQFVDTNALKEKVNNKNK
jgi:hypothetical protein